MLPRRAAGGPCVAPDIRVEATAQHPSEFRHAVRVGGRGSSTASSPKTLPFDRAVMPPGGCAAGANTRTPDGDLQLWLSVAGSMEA